MAKVKYLILGAGPAGLTFANELRLAGENSYLVLEKEMEAGGLCRSLTVDGSPFDIGGGHFLDVRRPQVNKFLFQFMPEEEWQLYTRDSRIRLYGREISHPLEANIWQFDMEEQVSYLTSVAQAGCNRGIPKPEKFIDWITWKLGERIAEDYMLPYNRKLFADDLDSLGTYWLEKLPDVSFEDTLRSCLSHRAYGSQPGHDRFYYPKKYGYGELWLRMAQALAPNIHYHAEACELDCNEKIVRTSDGEEYQAEKIITTIPWTVFRKITGMPEELTESVRRLKSSAVETRYLPQNPDTKAQWLYIPDADIPYHRILVRNNFCQDSRGCWLETRRERVGMFEQVSNFCYLNEYAYPLNTLNKPDIMTKLLQYCRKKKIYGLGRWGEHSHYNSDLVVEKAMSLAKQFLEK